MRSEKLTSEGSALAAGALKKPKGDEPSSAACESSGIEALSLSGGSTLGSITTPNRQALPSTAFTLGEVLIHNNPSNSDGDRECVVVGIGRVRKSTL